MPPLHPLIVHFPIALFVVAVLFDGITTTRYRRLGLANYDDAALKGGLGQLDPATRLLYIFSFLGAVTAVVTGEWLKSQRGKYLPHTLLTLHQALAFVFTAWLFMLLVLRLRKYWRPTGAFMSLSVIGVLILTAVGHTGGTMAWPAVKKLSPLAAGNVTSAPPVSGVSPNNGTAVGSGGIANTGVSSGANTAIENTSTGNNSAATNTANSAPGGSATLLKVGSRGQQVQQLQRNLAALGYFHHSITPYYGPITQHAVEAFQQAVHLQVTGVVDQSTWTTLGQDAQKKLATTQSTTVSQSNTGTASQNTTQKTTATASTQTTKKTTNQNQASLNQVRYQSGYQYFTQYCSACHSLGLAEQYYGRLSDNQWQQIVARMQSIAGGGIPNTSDIVYYLQHHR
jgi:peptidoglycan hydrolase-like protein with peptidoglycan-binding domain/uncharacterized membrane protein